MKKIVPFNNVLNFTTDVCEITAISLEHNIEKECDLISGSFYITGEYKMTDGEIKREKFDFELPFDIALGNNYDLNTLLVDIDDFRYELIDRNKLKVNIDMYIDGETIEIREEKNNNDDLRTLNEDIDFEEINYAEKEENYNGEQVYEEKDEDLLKEEWSKELKTKEELITETNKGTYKKETISEESTKKELNDIGTHQKKEELIIDEPTQIPIQERIDLLDEMLSSNKEDTMKEENINIENNNVNNNENNNIFTGFNEEEKYVTYHVYRVLDTDTIDKILEKYQVTKEELANYNNLEDLKPGDKLIIPANDK